MITYILETLVFQLVFLLTYDLFLKKETFFQWNRAYLLATYAFSLILPWIKIEALKTSIPEELGTATVFLMKLNGVTLGLEQGVSSFWSKMPWFYWLLSAGSLTAMLWFIYKLYQLKKLKDNGRVERYPEFTKVIIKDGTQAFSFFRNIYLGTEIQKEKAANVIAHELIHIKQWHSLDLLFFEVARILFWFNPLVYVYQNRIAELHEFIADAQAAKNNIKEHFQMLLSETFNTRNISFVNQFFNKSLIKKRIVMLTKEKSSRIKLLKYISLLPIIVMLLCYTSCEAQKKDKEDASESLVSSKPVPFGQVDEVPVFPGCEDAENRMACFMQSMQNHVQQHFRYPDEAEKLGIQGKVNLLFIINSDGAITDIRTKGPHELLEKEAERIIKLLPEMGPGKHQGKAVDVPFSIPIAFKL